MEINLNDDTGKSTRSADSDKHVKNRSVVHFAKDSKYQQNIENQDLKVANSNASRQSKDKTGYMNLPVVKRRNINNYYHRHQRGGTEWYGAIIGNFRFYAYSAFYDDRLIPGRAQVPHVVIVGIFNTLIQEIHCGLWSGSKFLHLASNVSYYKTLNTRKDRMVKSVIVLCPIRPRNSIPNFVGVDHLKRRLMIKPLFRVPVEIPQKLEQKKDFMICMNRMYFSKNESVDPIQPINVVEWVELNKILGVEFIAVYNHSMEEKIAKVFRYYEAQGFVQIFTRRGTPGEKPNDKPANDVCNVDCIYRFMHAYHKMVNIDIDEIIASYTVDKLKDVLLEEARIQNVSYDKTVFEFANQRYFTDDPRVQPGLLKTQFATRHIGPEYWRNTTLLERSKTIVHPDVCFTVCPHRCDKENVNPGARRIYVNHTRAVSRHFKSCYKSRSETKPQNCTAQFLRSIEDRSLQRFYPRLYANVKMVMSQLGFW